jgi:hypothetical protein
MVLSAAGSIAPVENYQIPQQVDGESDCSKIRMVFIGTIDLVLEST